MMAERRVTGANVLDLVKFVANREKSHGPQSLSPASRAVMGSRINLSAWYDIAFFHELLGVMDRTVIKGSETRALELGAAGGAAMKGAHKAYVVAGDAKSSVIAMRHAWRTHFNFGRLVFEVPNANNVLFRIVEYPDIPMAHGLMTAGWGLAAARAAGAVDASVEVLARPWLGGGDFAYLVEF